MTGETENREAAWTDEKLSETAHGYWESLALMSAVHLGLFDALADGPLADADLALKLGASLRGTSMLAEAMAAMGLVRRSADGVSSLTEFSFSRLTSSSPRSVRGLVEHMRRLLAEWTVLDRAVLEGSLPRREKTPERRSAFLGGMEAGTLLQASAIVPRLGLAGRKRLLDMGGATGAWSAAFLEQNPDLTAVVVDRPGTRESAEAFIASRGLAGRLSFHGCDFLTDPLPSGFDVVWISQVLHIFGPEKVLCALRRAYGSLGSGGLLLVHEFLLDRGGPLFPAIFALNMLTHTEEGRTWKAHGLMALMREAGFTDVRRLSLELSGGRGILAGVKA